MLLMQSLSLLGDTNDGNNSDNIYIYQKKLLLARIVLVMGFQIWPKVQQKTCWRTLLPCPSTGSKINCASQNDFWVHQKCNCIYCCSKNEFTTWNNLLVWHKKWFAHLLSSVWRFFLEGNILSKKIVSLSLKSLTKKRIRRLVPFIFS